MSERAAAMTKSPPSVATFAASPYMLQRQCACGQHSAAGGHCKKCLDKQSQPHGRARVDERHADIPSSVDGVLRSSGKPLDHRTREFFEPRFDHDFSRVRLHTDNEASESARAVNASAYTIGDHVVFQAGSYDPFSTHGRNLIAHELTHVVQNRNSSAQAPHPVNAVSHPSDESELEAARNAESLAHGTRATASSFASAHIHRALSRGENIGIGAGLAAIGAGVVVAGLLGAFDSKEKKARKLAKELQKLIDGATWKEIRKRVYPKESAAGIERAKRRKAGSLPDLTGLGKIANLEHFAAAVRGIQRQWPGKTADEHVRMLGNAANTELTRAEVPSFLHVGKALIEFKGFFTPSQWEFTISEELVGSGTLNDKDAGEVANTTMHESRHAEQDFLAARFAAGIESKDAASIATEHGIPRTIANQAVAKKFDAHTDADVVSLGRRMNQASVTDAASNQRISNDDGLPELATRRSEAQTALQALQAHATDQTIADAKVKRDALSAQITEVERRYGLYRNIPYEADAHEVGDAEEEAFKGWPR